jgi:tripartite-type tricarboxylate transporter receptor subunit TctC
MKATAGMTKPTGWHYHTCEAQFIYGVKGWVDLEFEDGSKIRVSAGESLLIPGGFKHNETAMSDDFELLDVSVPADMGTAIAQVKGGKVKSLGVTSEKRNPLVPDWPTVAETYPGFDVIGWHTIVAPANTPRDIRNKLYDAAAKALAKKEVVDALAGMGVTPGVMNPDELGAYIPAVVKRWAEMIKQAGIKPE